jgi:hypothetical protein
MGRPTFFDRGTCIGAATHRNAAISGVEEPRLKESGRASDLCGSDPGLKASLGRSRPSLAEWRPGDGGLLEVSQPGDGAPA